MQWPYKPFDILVLSKLQTGYIGTQKQYFLILYAGVDLIMQ